MTNRDTILTRIREALRIAAPPPGAHAAAAPTAGAAGKPGPGSDGFEDWLPPVGPTAAEQWALFAENAAALKAELEVCATWELAGEFLRRLARDAGWAKVASHRAPGIAEIAQAPGLPVVWTDEGYAIEDLESSDAGITGCDCLVAQTGSIMVSPASAGGRALSVLPPHHVVAARRSQLVGDLSAAFALARARYGDARPSYLSFITGPSRTGDIERILVLGAHGPKRVTIVVVDDAASAD